MNWKIKIRLYSDIDSDDEDVEKRYLKFICEQNLKKWITSKVLPSIRLTGKYEDTKDELKNRDKVIENKENMIENSDSVNNIDLWTIHNKLLKNK